MKSSKIPQIFCIFWTQIVFVWSQWIYDACDVYAIFRGARRRQTKAATERIITALQALHNNNNNKMHPACSGNQLYYYSIDVIKMLDSDRPNFGVTRGCHWRYFTCGHLSICANNDLCEQYKSIHSSLSIIDWSPAQKAQRMNMKQMIG